MDYRTPLSLGFMLLCGAVLVHSFQSANASMPVGMQHGQFPYEHFTDCDLPGATVHSSYSYCNFSVQQNSFHTLLTVPSDRIFIVTQAQTDSSCNFTTGGIPLISNYFIGYGDPGFGGNGHVVIPAGATLDVYLRSSNYCPFYIEGYYAHL